MSRPILDLRGFSTAQLIEELVRRSDARGEEKPRHWCDNCQHFVPWAEGKSPGDPMPDTYNPCEKRHTLQFQAPENIDDEWGHYRTVCADRRERKAA